MGWDEDLRALTERIAGPLFTRPEPRVSFGDLVRGLLADVARKNSWQLADHVGHRWAHRLAWLLNGASWDADALRDEIRDYVVEHRGGPDGVLIADDTQVIKKGVKSVGVAPQYCGATGQVENCQVMPMLTYASGRGHAFIDRALYLPECWTNDPERCAAAGVPADRGLTTKPQLVIGMLERAWAAGVPFGYFAADAGYGRAPALRDWCHTHQVRYVMAVGVDLPLLDAHGRPTRPDQVLASFSPAVWERRSCGQGTQGERSYDWAAVTVTVKDQPPSDGDTHTLLVRRSVPHPKETRVLPRPCPRVHPGPRAHRGRRNALEDRGKQ
jgi:SRSO17 transposase